MDKKYSPTLPIKKESTKKKTPARKKKNGV